MNAGKLVVELVMIGFQVVAWIVLLCLSIVGIDWINAPLLTLLKEWSFFLSIVLLGTSYMLGLVFDSVVSPIFKSLSQRRWRRLLRTDLAHMIPANIDGQRIEPTMENWPAWMGLHPEEMWFYVLYLSKDMALELKQRHQTLTLLRSTLVNAAIIGVLSAIVLFRNSAFSITLGAFLFFGVVLLIVLLFLTWNVTLNTYLSTVVGSLRLLDESDKTRIGDSQNGEKVDTRSQSSPNQTLDRSGRSGGNQVDS